MSETEEREDGIMMDRKQATNRVILWLGIAELTNKQPNYGQASMLSNLIFNLTDHKEVYTTCFIFDVWDDLYVKENESK